MHFFAHLFVLELHDFVKYFHIRGLSCSVSIVRRHFCGQVEFKVIGKNENQSSDSPDVGSCLKLIELIQ